MAADIFTSRKKKWITQRKETIKRRRAGASQIRHLQAKIRDDGKEGGGILGPCPSLGGDATKQRRLRTLAKAERHKYAGLVRAGAFAGHMQ